MFFKIGRLKNFAIFTGMHLFWGLFLIQLQVFYPANFLKRDSNTGASCGYCEIFKNSFFIEHLWLLRLTVLPRTVKSVGLFAFWFPASLCFRFWSKFYTKRCPNNYLLSRDKAISSSLELIDHMLSISEYVLKYR